MSPSASSDPVSEAADRLNAIAVPAARRRIAELGSDAAGAYNFYSVRAERGDMFADYERALVRALLADDGARPILHEVGAGYGTFSWLAAAVGFETVCIEMDVRRLEGGVALWNEVQQSWPDLPGSATFVEGRFPHEDVRPAGAWAIVTNLVATTSPTARAAIIAALGRYPVAIVDVDRFGNHAADESERSKVLEEFAHSGLACEPYLDLGASACFYRLTRACEAAM